MRTLIDMVGDGNMPRVFRKGGGGTTVSSSEGIPQEWRPYVTEGLKDAQATYKAGALSEVAGLTPEQQQALDRQKQLAGTGGALDLIAQDSYQAGQAYRDAAAGRGLFGANAIGEQTRALESTVGDAIADYAGQYNTDSALGGSLGSARRSQGLSSGIARTAADVATNELAARRQAALSGAQGAIGAGAATQSQLQTGANLLGQVGQNIQTQQQNELDAAYQGLQRFFGLLGSNAVGSEKTSTQTGGGK